MAYYTLTRAGKESDGPRPGSRHQPRTTIILPHHALDGLIDLAAVFGVLLLIVFDFDLSVHGEVDELSHGHMLIDLHRLLHRDLRASSCADPTFFLRSVDIRCHGPDDPFQVIGHGVASDIHATQGKICGSAQLALEISVKQPVKVYKHMPVGQLIYFPVDGEIEVNTIRRRTPNTAARSISPSRA